jgi:hypothetical protein
MLKIESENQREAGDTEETTLENGHARYPLYGRVIWPVNLPFLSSAGIFA